MPTVPASPQSSQSVLFVIRAADDVKAFADDVKRFMDGWLHGTGDQPTLWRLCKLLLSAIKRTKFALSCDEEIAEKFGAWQL